jgi:hypothetical protein
MANPKPDEHPEDFFGPLGSAERRKRLRKNSQLKCVYGITLYTYERMGAAQNWLCDICGEPERGIHNRGDETVPMSLCVDHDHETGAVRGLLCTKCNKALGLFNDDIQMVARALGYLKQHGLGD